MSSLHIRHIENHLRTLYTGEIDLSDVPSTNKDDLDNCFLSRGLAAYALKLQANIQPKTAAESVTDGFKDSGIDLMYYDPQDKILYLCQSKWNKKGTKGIEIGEVLKFIEGIKGLIEFEFGSFNDRIRARQAEIEQALIDPNTSITLLLVTSSVQPLSADIQKRLDDFTTGCNDATDLISWTYMNQRRLHDSLLAKEPIDLDIRLLSWGFAVDPIIIYYGQIDAGTVASWANKYGRSLFTENIRYYKGTTDVNDAIRRTLELDPELFLYLNNGITALCSTIEKRPGIGHNEASFICRGFNIVNGAQTVGSIMQSWMKNPECVNSAKVLLRLVSLQDSPESFGRAVTIASNTQNRVEHRDFVSLDPLQAHLAQYLLLDGKTYRYKSGEEFVGSKNVYSLVEATVALACAHPDIGLAVQAKREIGLLWEDVTKPPYTLLFNASLTSIRMSRLIEVLRIVDETLRSQAQSLAGRERLTCIHGNRFILHKVFQAIDRSRLDDPGFDMNPFMKAIPGITQYLVRQIGQRFTNELVASYPATFFKNASKCKDLDDEIAVGIIDSTMSMNFPDA